MAGDPISQCACIDIAAVGGDGLDCFEARQHTKDNPSLADQRAALLGDGAGEDIAPGAEQVTHPYEIRIGIAGGGHSFLVVSGALEDGSVRSQGWGGNDGAQRAQLAAAFTLQIDRREFLWAIDGAPPVASAVIFLEIDKPGPLIGQMRAIVALHDAAAVHDDLVLWRRLPSQVNWMSSEFEYFRVVFGEYLLGGIYRSR